MSYTGLIDSQLKKAFTLAKDLAITAKFHKVVSSSFDFQDLNVTTVVDPEILAKIIVYDGKKQAKGSSKVSKQLMVKAKDVGELSAYDTLEFDGYTWTIGEPIKGTGFIYVLEVYREAK